MKEVLLIAQELTYYGLDFTKRALADLLKELSSVEGLVWIRLHYAYPHKFPMDILDAIQDYPKVCDLWIYPCNMRATPCYLG